MVTLCFRMRIWDHASGHKELMKPSVTAAVEREYRIGCNLAMGNAVFEIAVTFFSPAVCLHYTVHAHLHVSPIREQWVARLDPEAHCEGRIHGARSKS